MKQILLFVLTLALAVTASAHPRVAIDSAIAPVAKIHAAKTHVTKQPQCEAITKKGTRCKRTAAEHSKYCAQHAKYTPSK